MPEPASPMPRPRRSPGPAERQRDPERTRERILAAAIEEFGAKGYAGARVRQIASRAGLSQQLISYYFGGKSGLYAALQERWRATSADLSRPELTLDHVVVNFLTASLAHRSWARLLAWEGLTDEGTDQPGQAAQMQWMVDELRRRQRGGELAEDLDPAHVALLLFAAAAAPTILPQVARRVIGSDPGSEDFVRQYGEQLARVVRHLAS